jgi:hypothetical protein
MEEHDDWTRYHVTHWKTGWRFTREGMKRSIKTNKDKSAVMKTALYKVEWDGGYLVVHNEDGTVDFVVDNWCG